MKEIGLLIHEISQNFGNFGKFSGIRPENLEFFIISPYCCSPSLIIPRPRGRILNSSPGFKIRENTVYKNAVDFKRHIHR